MQLGCTAVHEGKQCLFPCDVTMKSTSLFIQINSCNLPYTFCEQIGKEIRDISDEIPFEIPESWEWVRLGFIGDWGSGATPSRTNKEYYDGNIPWLKTGDLNDGIITNIPEKITELALEKTSVRLNPVGSVLIAMYGATIGKLGILNIPATTNQACCACLPILINNNYLFYFLMSHKESFTKKAEGGAQPNISKEKIISTLFPLPPLAEQKRIVEKIEQLLPFIEKYEQAETQLTTLNTTFPEMLKKSILQEAVQGKLVPQNPDDGPASVLLERIRAEKQKLIKAGKIKKSKHESVIITRDKIPYEIVDGKERCIADDVPFEIPESWCWCRLSHLYSILNGDRGKNYPSKDKLKKHGIPFISAINLDGTKVVEDDKLLCVDETQYNLLNNGKLIKDDIVVCIRGSLGKHARCQLDRGAIASSLVIMRSYCHSNVFASYLMLYLDSPLFFTEIKKYDNGTVQPNLAAKCLEEFFIPLPPLAEQKRIVEKIEELIPMINSMSK